MKEVLVLGGGGFIGRNIVEFLVNRGDCNVIAADIKKGSNWQEISDDASRCDRFKAVLEDFTDISKLLKTSPPRSASIFLYTEIYNEDAIISRSMSGETSTVDINDLSWRYPLI